MTLGNVFDNYQFIKELGKGSYGVVYHVVERASGEEFAMKMYPLNRSDEQLGHNAKIGTNFIERVVLREIGVLKKLNHEHTVKMHKTFLTKMDNCAYICVLIDLCEGTLASFCNSNKPSKEGAIRKFLQILAGLNYLNKLGYIHGDLNPINIMISGGRNIKLIDFGLSRRVYREYDQNLSPTVYVRPIELVQRSKNFDIRTIDSWALGYIFYFLLTHVPLLFSSNEMEQFQNIIDLFGVPSYEMIRMLGIDPANIVGKFKVNPSLEIIKCDYKGELKLLKNMLQYSPFNRPSVPDLVRDKDISFYSRVYGIHLECNLEEPRHELGVLKLGTTFYEGVVDVVIELVVENNLSYEIINYVTHNLQKLARVTEFVNTWGDHFMAVSIVLFWLGVSIISTQSLLLKDTVNILARLELEYGYEFIQDMTISVLEYLDWDTDPDTFYSYIKHVPSKYRLHFEYLNFVLVQSIDTCDFPPIDLAVFSCTVIASSFNIACPCLNMFISKNFVEKLDWHRLARFKKIGNILDRIVPIRNSERFLGLDQWANNVNLDRCTEFLYESLMCN